MDTTEQSQEVAEERWKYPKQTGSCLLFFFLASQMAPGSKRWKNKPAEHEHKKQTQGCLVSSDGKLVLPMGWVIAPASRGHMVGQAEVGRWQMASPDQLANDLVGKVRPFQFKFVRKGSGPQDVAQGMAWPWPAQGPSNACVMPGTRPSAFMSWIHMLQHPSGSYLKLSCASMPDPCSKFALWRAIPRSNPPRRHTSPCLADADVFKHVFGPFILLLFVRPG